jgi:uncharacterized protein YecT (DUF1311 family)
MAPWLIATVLVATVLLPQRAVRAEEDKWDFAAPYKQRCSTGTMLDMNECLAGEHAKVDARLNEVYKRLVGSLAQPESLRKAQTAWLRFRDLDCAYSSSGLTDGASLKPFSDNACLSDHAEKRIRELERYLSWDCNGCPPLK